ncbi:alpha-amylase, partial [bacterium]|nr:alpha-amylase [candidate division CSSED10-310 bacterium]
MEFHISRKARDKYQFDQSLYQFSGNVIFSDFYTVRQFAQKINEKKDLLLYPEQAVKASQINALGLIDEILHIVFALYREQKAPDVTDKALKHLQNKLGNEQVEAILKSFLVEFPPLSVYKKEMNMEQYLASSTDGISNRANTLEEIIMLWLSNKNPAFTPYNELFSDETLQNRSKYLQFMAELQSFFDTQPFFGPGNLQLIDMLQSPALAAPYSLQGQLDYIRMHWADLLGRHLFRLLTGLDLIKEEEKLHLPGPGEIPVPTYQSGLDDEAERFSEDREWMPRLVLVAKNTHVWLDQLSKKYQKKISRLDEIPDEELDILARRGFTGLWLIGIWERSRASARIKQLCGNPEAIASAYSLMSYHIAADLGGESSYNDLQKRAWQKGIRMASDMVPNHMGIDSDWVADRPDWFLSLDYCPFPAYSFNGENLSSHDNCSIFIEDHYFDRTDAAVVFKHIDHSSNRTRFIYHGNDGTSMPWNDTAQLNYLNPEVREAVIQTIIKVAKKFPIIRFDAAMTLTKRHYQRLWFPEPGSGGDIPTRAENGMSKAQFDEKIPVEFWREVVERITSEVPDTLLLAEAFWLMESYFVRSLGMHRVYNSAFMNLLRDEDNARYRMVMKNTLEFDPEILKRYVNFMNNPDERTAVDQFGKDDKYFGICTLMCTLPGLPMFGHGQIEGFSEKYGMEYRRSYWDEQPDEWLLKRHEKEIFPLLHRRALFAEVANFLLYDFYTVDGIVNEDVFAYSNRSGNERALVVYQNRFASTQGWIRTSVGFSQKSADGERNIVESTLDKGLNIHPNEHSYLLFRDVITGLEYIRSTIEVCNQGLFFNLNAYQHHVFVDFRVVHDVDNSYKDICEYLNGQGVP